MSCSIEKREPPSPGPDSPLKRPPMWTDLWFKKKKALNHVLLAMHLQSSLESKSAQSPSLSPQPASSKTLDFNRPVVVSDRTSLLSDGTLLQILSRLPKSQWNSNSLVSKRWLNLQGRLVRSLKVLDWNFLVSGRLHFRFPNLINVDLVNGSVLSSLNSGVLFSHRLRSFHFDSGGEPQVCVTEKRVLSTDEVDSGLRILAAGCPNLRKLVVVNASEMGLLSVSEECPTLQELELHRCNDKVLRGIAACQNLQILKLIASVDGLYSSLVSDIGLTILAQGCKRLVRLELSGCEGSFDGIKAIGQCCLMLEELTICDHRMEDGWLLAVSYCENLKTLRLSSCKKIDLISGSDEFLSPCPTLERLHIERCQLRDMQSTRALFFLTQSVREIVFENCWGLDDDMFSSVSICRMVKFLSLEGCSLLTTGGLESVVLSWKELQSLKVMSCNNMKDSDLTPALSILFSGLKDLKWRPDTKSLLSENLVGSGCGKKGSKFFRKSRDWRLLPDA